MMRAAFAMLCVLAVPPFPRRRESFLHRFLIPYTPHSAHLHRCRHPEVWVYKLHQAAGDVLVVADTANICLERSDSRMRVFKTL